MKNILIVDDDVEFRSVLEQVMLHEGHSVLVADSCRRALTLLEECRESGTLDLVVSDMMLGDGSGLDVLNSVRRFSSDLPVVFVTAFGSMENVAEAMRKDVFDYVAKPFDTEHLLAVVRRALALDAAESTEGVEIPERREESVRIIGSSPAMVDLYKAIARVSPTDATVFLSGESGTGKELVARAVHQNSPRSKRPFVAVNCGAFTETLLESELFGHVRGAYTGAHSSREGLFESAEGGTIFLDEISETSLNFQVKLLRVLQEHKVRPVGSNAERQVNVRVLAATNRSLKQLLGSRDFRRDLFYRLCVIHLRLPALRERREDIPLLAEHFIQRFAARQRKTVRLPAATLDWLVEADWPGNVRELEHSVERAVTLNVTGELTKSDFMQFGIVDEVHDDSASSRGGPTVSARKKSDSWVCRLPMTLEEVEREHITATLAFTGGNKVRSAEILGIGRWSLYRKAKRLGISMDGIGGEDPKPGDGDSDPAD